MKLVKIKEMTIEIHGYGYDYSIKKFMLQLLATYVLLIVVGLFFQLNIYCLAILCVWALLCLPIIILAQFRYLANNKKFETLVGYLEQSIFAFKKSPKILETFKNILDVVDKDMRPYIEKAIKIIENDKDGKGYSKAFAIIEKEYPCTRIKALHKFMLNVEMNGGQYQRSIDILLDDIRSWISRTYDYQKELKGIKGKIMLSIALSILVAGTMVTIIPKELVVFGDSIVYLISTTILFGLLITLIAFVQSKLNGKWFVDDTIGTSNKVIQNAMNYFNEYDERVMRKKSIISFCITLPILILGICIQSGFIIFLGVLVSIFTFFNRKLKYKNSRKTIQRALEKEFPLWLRDISLQVQTLVVPLAIRNSVKESPIVLQPHLKKLVYEIEKNPTSIKPYNDFLGEYHLSDVSNAMKMLYTIQSLSMDDAQNQIDDLIKRNQKMLAKSERIRNEDILTGIGFIVAFPMIVATLKLIVDLVLILAGFMSMTVGIL